MHEFMRKLIFVFMIGGLLAGCSKPTEATIEEQVIIKTFALYQSALAYNEICNGVSGKNRFDFSKSENVQLIGHEQMLAARAGGVQHVRFPDADVETLVDRLVKSMKAIRDGAVATLNEKGCDSSEGQARKKHLDLFLQAHPSQIYSLIDKEIVKNGGTVTSLEEISAIKKVVPETKE